MANTKKGVVFIYRRELLNDISIFTSQSKQKFYSVLFLSLNLDCLPSHNAKTGRNGVSNHAFVCAFIVMKCDGLSQLSYLYDYLIDNLVIAHYCGFYIFNSLPSYASFTRFIRDFDNEFLQSLMQSAVLQAASLSLIDLLLHLMLHQLRQVCATIILNSLVATNLIKTTNQKPIEDCALGVQTTPNRSDEEKYEFY